MATVSSNGLHQILDESRFVRLGKGVDASGNLNPERVEAAIEAIRELKAKALELKAADLIAFGTSAIRDAANGGEFVQRVDRETGVKVRILSGEEEAKLTFLGATSAASVGGEVLICDLGGGSAELISAHDQTIRWERSLQIGSGRLSERFVHSDPPTLQERAAIVSHMETVLSQEPEASPATMIATGGTASHLAHLAGKTASSPDIELAAVARVEDLLYSVPSETLVRDRGIDPERAKVLPAGVTALYAIAKHYRPNRFVITRRGIREGAILQACADLGYEES